MSEKDCRWDRKLVLIDGHSILNRAFYGVPDLTNAQGLHTNAVFGFLNIMFKILEEEQPDYLAVAFDVHAPTFRHQMYEEYKGTRKPMPEELRQQVPVMKDVLKAMGIVIVEQPGLEADDILGTLAKKAEAEGIRVALVSGDRDLLQIADQHIMIRIPKTKMGRTEIEDYYPEDVVKTYQVTPLQFIDLKALMGDSSDNVPGVPKVGQKTATELMVQYGSMDNIYAHVEEISKKSIRESLIANRELADLSKALVTIKIDSDVSIDYEAAKAEGFYTKEAYSLFKELEFKNMLGRFEADSAASGSSLEDIRKTFRREGSQKAFLARCRKIKNGQRLGLFLAWEGGRLLGAALADGKETAFWPAPYQENVQMSFFGEEYGGEGEDEALLAKALQELSARTEISAFDIKRQYRFLSQDSTERYFDILIGAYLLNPLKSDYDCETIAWEHLGLQIPGWKEIFEKARSLKEARETSPEGFMEYCCLSAFVAEKVRPLSGYEHLADAPAQLHAHGNILQIWLRGADSPGGRDGLVEVGVDPLILPDVDGKPVRIGGFQLGKPPVFQNILHDGIFLRQLLQHIRRRGIAGLCLFPSGKLHGIKQHLTQLFGRIDVEFHSRLPVDLAVSLEVDLHTGDNWYEAK